MTDANILVAEKIAQEKEKELMVGLSTMESVR